MDIQSKDWFLLMFGVALGGLIGLTISRYYFRQSFVKSLTPYLMFHASPMSGMGADVRSALSVQFRGNPVSNLIEAQFLVINDGAKALRDVIEPLRLRGPANLRILDAQVVQHQSPALEVLAQLLPDPATAEQVELRFRLLNAKEWFIFKVLADGPADSIDWKWSIVADELPRTLALKRLTLEDLGAIPVSTGERKKLLRRGLVGLVLIAGSVGGCVGLNHLMEEPATKNSWLGLVLVLGWFALFFLGIWAFGLFSNAIGKAVQGLKLTGRSLPSLPADVVEDLWRGHSAQPDAVQWLRKINKTES